MNDTLSQNADEKVFLRLLNRLNKEERLTLYQLCVDKNKSGFEAFIKDRCAKLN